jgi:hypothetical protein
MASGIVQALVNGILFLAMYSFVAPPLLAQRGILNVMVKGQVQRPPRGGVVRVQLVYLKHSKEQNGESGEVTLDGESFRIQIPFLMQSSAPVLRFVRPKCDLTPKTVVVTLLAGDHEYDRISLDWAKDFEMTDPTAYTLRTPLMLHGEP